MKFEIILMVNESANVWYLPIFVYHAKKILTSVDFLFLMKQVFNLSIFEKFF
jgi:hypothetical protein